MTSTRSLVATLRRVLAVGDTSSRYLLTALTLFASFVFVMAPAYEADEHTTA